MSSRSLAFISVLLLALVSAGCLERFGQSGCAIHENGRCVAYEVDLNELVPLSSPEKNIAEPGTRLVVLPPATRETDLRAVRQREARRAPVRLAKAAVATSAVPVAIVELARALKGDPDLIYEYVRNNIEFYPIWGIHKGAVGAISDKQGTAFDQAALMVALLRQSGYTASFVKGQVVLTAAQVEAFFGIDVSSVCAVSKLLANGQIPVAAIYATTSGDCTTNPLFPLHSAKIDHIWVKVDIGGTEYHFDPGFKPHTRQPGIDLASASGYDASAYLSEARSGATITSDYVQNINRTNVRNRLNTYATNLADTLRANKPAATLDDVIGGKRIVPHDGTALRQTELPYQDDSVTPEVWTGEIPASYKPTLQIRYSGIDETYTSDAIYGKRLTITYNASNQPLLKLEGETEATGAAVAAGSTGTVTFNIVHPYASTFADREFTQSIGAGGTFLIGNGWGPTGWGTVEHHRTRLSEARAAGNSDASEPVLGSMLAMLSSSWLAQRDQSNYIIDRLAKTNTLFHHQVGLAGYNTTPYVDLPDNTASIISEVYDSAKEGATFFSSVWHASILESAAVQQTADVSAVSTTKLVDIATANGDKIFDANAFNYATTVQPALQSCASWSSYFQAYIDADYRLILPERCNITENQWSGAGFFSIYGSGNGSYVGTIIGGYLAGGFASSTCSATDAADAAESACSANEWRESSGSAWGDPVDVAKGNYLYAREDLLAGVGAFPHSLGFQKLYSSGLHTQDGPLGRGWTHNLAVSARVGSDGMQAMGEDSALDAVGVIVEKMVSLDLFLDANKPLDKLVIAALGARWYSDQLLDNTVVVKLGLNGEVFVKLPDDTYNAPPGNPARLIRNANGTYTYETLNKARFDFDSVGKLSVYRHPSGVQANFTYSGDNLTKVENSLGRTLTFTNTAGRITQVSDGARNVQYTYDASGNLIASADPLSNTTTFAYDSPGRLTQISYPSQPTVPFVTNVYDSQGRIQTQTDANNAVYTYYFAGSRSEEEAPDSTSKILYLDTLGKTLKSIDELGRVTTHVRDGQSRPVETTFPEGNRIEYTYDDTPCAAQKRCTHNIQSISRVPKPNSGLATLTDHFTYESDFNKIASATDPRGQQTAYTYTAQGNPLTATAPADASGVSPVTTYSYTSFTRSGFPAFYLQTGEVAKTSASNTITKTTSYLASNKYVPQTVVLDAGTGKLNLTTTLTFDVVGNLTLINGPRTDVADQTAFAYDAARRLTQITDALGKYTRHAYDQDGRRIRTALQVGGQWLVSCQNYSATGKPVKIWGPGQTSAATTCPNAAAPVPVIDYAYNTRDWVSQVTENLTIAQGGNRVTAIAYLGNGAVANIQRAVGSALAQTYATYTYTANGQLQQVQDALGRDTAHDYDGHDRKIKTHFPDKTTGLASNTDYEQYDYDAAGNLVSLRKRSGQTLALAYDNLNRLISKTYPDTADNVSYAYDLLGRRTAANLTGYAVAYTWDNAGRLTSTTAGGKTLGYQYDAAGNRTRLTWPDASYVTATFDALNRPTALTEQGTTNLAGYAYDDLSRRTTVTLGNGTATSHTYDAQGTLSNLAHNLSGTDKDIAYTYTRNQAGEITTLAWNNNLYQWGGAASGTTDYANNKQDQYTNVGGAAYSYDGNGNLTGDGLWTYGYDLDNRLRTASKSGLAASLGYDAEGRLRKTTLDGTETELLYDGVDLVAEYGGAGALLRKYVHGPGIDEPLVVVEGSARTWLYADHQGSVVGQANVNGTSTALYNYGPFGEPDTNTGVRFRYTGQQYLGALGLHYYKARFYSPTLGRFLQTDPVGTIDDLNLYAYVGNNPVNFSDPSGELVNVAAGIAGAIIGGVGGGVAAYMKSGGDLEKTSLGVLAGAGSGAFIGATFGASAAMSTGALAAHNAATGAVSAVGGNVAGQLIGNVGKEDGLNLNLTEAAVAGVGGVIPGGMLGALRSVAVRSGLAQSVGNTAGSLMLVTEYRLAVAPFEIIITDQLPEVILDFSNVYNSSSGERGK
ncbi:MAG: DUF6531 domain-containing protein [Azoarcus sp.]|nr:DUF6531 domain-containing protein [Azoarcus sp.]